MKNKNGKNKKTKKQICKIFLIYFAIAAVVFLSLPLIFSEDVPLEQNTQASKTLPLDTENPFTNYLKLFKNFYSPKKAKNKENRFNLVKNKKPNNYYAEVGQTFSEEVVQGVALKDASKEGDNNASNNTSNYYADMKEPTFYFPPENPQNTNAPFAQQENTIPIAVEGLYETSQTDPFEKKQAARKKLFSIFSPKRTLSLLSSDKQKEDGTSINIPTSLPEVIFAKNTASSNNNTLKRASSNSTYFQNNNTYGRNGFIDSFGNSNIFIPNGLDISGLPFDDQVSLVAGRLNTIRQNNYENSNSQNQEQNNNNNNNGNNNNGNNNNPVNPDNPNPPAPPKDTFEPSKWDQDMNPSCDIAAHNPQYPAQEQQGTIPQMQIIDFTTHTSEPTQEQTQETTQTNDPDKIPSCDIDDSKINNVNNQMQQKYNFFIVSGRYKGQIMLPAQDSLSDYILKGIIVSENSQNLQIPKELSSDEFEKNTDKTKFDFASALKPKVFNQIMKDENTLLLSVDENDLNNFPDKTILIKSGEIETYEGLNRIIGEINNFPAKQAELKKLAEQKEAKDKEKKAQDLQQKIESSL